VIDLLYRCTRCGLTFEEDELITLEKPEEYVIGDMNVIGHVKRKCCPECGEYDRLELVDPEEIENESDTK